MALALAVVVAAPSGAAATASGGIGLRLLEAPAISSDDPRAQIYIVDHLAPGTVIKRNIEVLNTTSSTARVALYPAAATIEKGSFLGAAGRTKNELSTWTKVRPRVIGLSAGERATATVTIAIADDAAPGENYGVVWAETRSRPAGRGVTQVNRVGIRMYLSVGPGGAPAADFSIDSLTPERAPNGQPMITATVHNTGGRALDMNGTLELVDGPGGLSAGPFPATLGTTLAIGDTESVEILLDERLPDGPWDARIVLHSGLLDRSARATVTFPTDGTAAPVPTEPESPGLFDLVIRGLIALLLFVIGVVLVTSKRHHHHRAIPNAG